jgi:hypothetical protein
VGDRTFGGTVAPAPAPSTPLSNVARRAVGGGLTGAAIDTAIAAPEIYKQAKSGDYAGAASELGTAAGQGAAYGALAAVPVVGPPAAALAGMMSSTSQADTLPLPKLLARTGLGTPGDIKDYEDRYGRVGYDPANGSIVLPKGAPTPKQHQAMSAAVAAGGLDPTSTKRKDPGWRRTEFDPTMLDPTMSQKERNRLYPRRIDDPPSVDEQRMFESVELRRILTLSGIGNK